MQSTEIRKRFLEFFEKRGHKIIPSASLVPENDPSVLFTTAGMQPLAPYLLGEKHPQGKRLANIQKCVRTQDIDEVGDNTHDTFFEMLGNWSLGDYWKDDAIKWSYELLTSKTEGVGLDPKRLYVTVFEGDPIRADGRERPDSNGAGSNAPVVPRDTESAKIWEKVGIPSDRIYFMSAETNWWSAGDNGPCGPDTEIFYDLTGKLGKMSKAEYIAADKRQDVVEIWNNVFMEYEKKDGKVVGKLPQRNVDTGAGLERWCAVLQGKNNIFETDLFQPIMAKIGEFTTSTDERAKRIVADHIRTAVFMIADGVTSSNTDRGYILRRLLRRAVRYADVLGMKHSSLFWIAETVVEKYKDIYKNLEAEREKIKKEIDGEESKFRTTLERGMKEFGKGTDPFILFTTYGFPIELTLELAKESGMKIDLEDFQRKIASHQNLSRASSTGMFKGGLANQNEKTVRLHTAHHLLLAALQEVLGKEVKQRGSNITEERLRIDFVFGRKMTDEEKKLVEDIVNKNIKAGLNVVRREMPLSEAEKIGAEMEFGAKYPDVVSVYFIEDKNGNPVSKEFCGGPHVKNTNELGSFKILKEEAVSAGIRRIKAVLA